jgi:hypothetical protein
MSTAEGIKGALVEEKPARHSRAGLAFRFLFALTFISSFQFVSWIANFLEPESLRQRVEGWLELPAMVETRTMMFVGAWTVRAITRDRASVGDMITRYNRDATAGGLCYLLGFILVASAFALAWHLLDRRPRAYRTANAWMRLYARVALALVTIVYAMVKVIPTQFGFLTPGELMQPFGKLTRFTVLWNFMAVSTGYTIFTGSIELGGALLVLYRRTVLPGALVLAGALVNVFALDLAYHVSAGATHIAILLLALDVVLLAHYARSLAGLLLHGKCELPPEPVAFRWRFGPLAMTLLIVWSLSIRVHQGIVLRRPFYGTGHPIYGLYDVVEFKGGGTTLAWKRVAGDGRYDSGSISVQLANGEVEKYILQDDPRQRTWTLRRGRDSAAELRYTVDPDDSASLDGRVGSDPVHMRLHRVDPEKLFPLARK